jgi:hypothetical protein
MLADRLQAARERLQAALLSGDDAASRCRDLGGCSNVSITPALRQHSRPRSWCGSGL